MSLSETLSEEVRKTYISNVQIVEALADSFDFKTLFYWQPVVFTKNNLTETEQKLVENFPAYQAFLSEIYEIQSKSPYLREQSNFHDNSLIFYNDP